MTSEKIEVKVNPAVIDTAPGKKIEDLVCDKCKDRIQDEMQKISRLSLLNPVKVAMKMQGLLCEDCLRKAIKRLKK